jgi:taurine-pyruvate aminotransferase
VDNLAALDGITEEQVKAWDAEHVLSPGFRPGNIVFVGGEGAVLRDIHGREYLDFTSSTYNVSAGHGHTKIIEAAIAQLRQLGHTHMTTPTVPKSLLARLLNDLTDESLTSTITATSGSEANEAAFILARRAAAPHNGHKIVAHLGAFHGASLGALAATCQSGIKPSFVEPLVPGFIHVPPPYCYRCPYGWTYPACDLRCAQVVDLIIRESGADNFAAIITEPIISALGALVPPDGYLRALREICDRYGLVLIFDEVVTGFGRTGTLFGYEQSGVVPDILTLGKGITSGYVPLSATVVTRRLADIGFEPHFMGHTYTGHPVSCAVACATIQVILEERLVENSAKMGAYLTSRLLELKDRYPLIGDVRGRGLLIALELVKDVNKKPAFEEGEALGKLCRERGLIVWPPNAEPEQRRLQMNACVLINPPLCTTREQIDHAVDIISGSLDRISCSK